MKNLKEELKRFKEFYKNYKFEMLNIENNGGVIYYKDIIITDEAGNTINETDKFINVGYKLKGPYSKTLSNLFPYKFTFKGKKVNSIESIFQALKFKDKKMQNLVLQYDRLDANNIKIASDYDWKETGELYWQGKVVNRFSLEYEEFILELYVSAIQNPLYRNILKQTNKYILHSIGEVDERETVFTRYEFEKMLNALSEYVKGN